MHRSGTTLMAKSLERAGIFMGVVKDHNYEAMHFLSLNQQALWAAGASWLEPKVPEPLHYKTLPAPLLYQEHFKLVTGWQKFSHQVRGRRWGWKDPRNTFTLPMWLQLFPKARVLHIYRDEEAVAHSLKERNRVRGEVHDARLNDLDFNRRLARLYREQGFSYARVLGSRYHDISYEGIVKKDDSAIRSLEKFSDVKLQSALNYYLKT